MPFPSIHLTQKLKASRGFIIPVPPHLLPLGVRYPCKAVTAIFVFNITKRREVNYSKTFLSTLPIWGGTAWIWKQRLECGEFFCLSTCSVMEMSRKCSISVQVSFSSHCYISQGREGLSETGWYQKFDNSDTGHRSS